MPGPLSKEVEEMLAVPFDCVVDISKAYDLHANCYVTKPVDLEKFIDVVRSIEDFWVTIVKLPPDGIS